MTASKTVSVWKALVCLALVAAFSQSCGKKSEDSTSSAATAESTTVNLVGALNFTSSSSSSSLRLAQSTSTSTSVSPTDYWLKCVTLDLTGATACIDQLDVNGAFDLTCDGFKEKAFGCFVLTGSDPNNLTIVGILTSSQLAVGKNSSKVSLALNFDPSSGAVSVSTIEQTSATNEEVVVEDTGTFIPSEVSNLSITSGRYGFCMVELGREERNDFVKGDKAVEHNFEGCEGFTEEFFVNYLTTAVTGDLPVLEMWRSEDAMNACRPGGNTGAVTYHLSDGTRSYSFTQDDVSFNSLFNVIYNNGTDSWMPSAAVENYKVALAGQAEEQGEDVEELKEGLEQIYGEGAGCAGIVDDLIAGYKKATVAFKNGVRQCEGFTFKVGAGATANTAGVPAGELAQFESMFNQPGEGPPAEWCSIYKDALKAGNQDAERKKFIAECQAHVEGKVDESLWQKQGIVEEFLNTLGEARHQQGGENRTSGLRDAFNYAASVGLDLSETGIADLSKTCDNGVKDAALAALASEWQGSDWNWERSRFVDQAIEDDGDLNCSAISFKPFEGGTTFTWTNGRDLLKDLLSKSFRQALQDKSGITGPSAPAGSTEPTGIADMNQQVCQDLHEFDLSRIVTTAAYFTTFKNSLDFDTGEPQWKSTVAASAKQGLILDFFRALTAKTGETGAVAGGPFVFGCTATQIKSQLNFVQNDTSGRAVEDVVRGFGWAIRDHLFRSDLTSIDTSITTLTALDIAKTDSERATLAATQLPSLAVKVVNLALNHPDRFGWLLNDMCRLLDIGTLTGLAVAGVACGQAVPASIAEKLCRFIGGPGGPGGGGTSCSLPAFESASAGSIPKQHILAELTRRIAEIKGREAFRTDDTYKQKLRSIEAKSSCLPDSSLSHQPILDANDDFTFGVTIRGPVKRRMAGALNLDLSAAEKGTTASFIVEDSRLQKEEGGMGSEGCFWGEVQRLKNLTYTNGGDDAVIKGVYSQSFVDTCRGSRNVDQGESAEGSSEESTENGGFTASFSATLNPDSEVQ
ncbi:MAG: hypothetical protein HYW48_08035 [Deltaproteobacteria bacterium]|nr:hypothetical protein [Deltaproteobacteria bacterium]